MLLLLALFFVFIVVAVFVFLHNYSYITKPIIETENGENVSLYIPTGADYQYVKNEIIAMNVLKSEKAFNWLAKKTNYDENVHPGRYVLVDGMTNQQLITMLRMGYQTPVKVVFNNMRTVEQGIADRRSAFVLRPMRNGCVPHLVQKPDRFLVQCGS